MEQRDVEGICFCCVGIPSNPRVRKLLDLRSRGSPLPETSDDGGNDAQDCKEHARGCGYAGSLWPLKKSFFGGGAETQVADGGGSRTFADVQSELLD